MFKVPKISIPTLIISILILLLIWPVVAVAEEETAKYSFAAAQGSSSLQVIPGGDAATGVIYFYNVDGNRITHITIERTILTEDNEGEFPDGWVEAPDSWEVEIDPPLDEQEYEVGGYPITIEENLYVEPTEVASEEITNVPEGMTCLTLPNKLGEGIPGYAIAKPVYITVSVPESEGIGTTGKIRITATGEWLGQTGDAAIAQTQKFDFTVNTVYELTEETPIISGGGFDIGKWLPWIIVGVLVIVGGVVIIRLSAKSKKA